MKRMFLVVVCISMSILSHAASLTIQSTTSTRDSGLYEYLLPYYPEYKNVKIKVIAVGTGQAIKFVKEVWRYDCISGLFHKFDENKFRSS